MFSGYEQLFSACIDHRVGDMIKFGLSTRLYLFGGPEELRPAEGLSKLQRRQLAALEVCAVNPTPPCSPLRVRPPFPPPPPPSPVFPVEMCVPVFPAARALSKLAISSCG